MSSVCIAKTVDELERERIFGISVDKSRPLSKDEAALQAAEKKEIQLARLERERQEAATAYARAREAEYPPVGDQLDAIWKALNTMQLNGTANLPAEADLVLNRILAVKRKYPKPETKE